MEGGGDPVDGVAGGRRASSAGEHAAEAAGPGRLLHAGRRRGHGEKSI